MDPHVANRAGGKHILLVDDDPANSALLKMGLARKGYGVRCVGDGREAARLLADEPADLVLLDLRLPGMNGLDVCRWVKSQPNTSKIPVIIMSGGWQEDQRRALDAGAAAYFGKPFNPFKLFDLVGSLLEQHV